MKWLIVPTLLASLVSLHAAHHPVQGHHQGQGHHDSAHVAKTLNLTPNQQARIRDIRVDFLRQIIRSSHDDAFDHVATQKLAESALTKLTAVLTPEQQTGLKNQGGAHALLDMTAAHFELCAPLKLSANQEAKMKVILAETMKAKHELFAAKLSPEVTHVRMRELVKGTMRQFHELLTPEQIKKAHEMLQGGSS